MKPWVQELIWVRRNEQGVVVGMSDKLPEQADFIPTVLSGLKRKEARMINK